MDQYLTVPQVAKLLQVSKTKVYDLVNDIKIEHVRLDRNVRISQSALEAYLAKHTLKPVH